MASAHADHAKPWQKKSKGLEQETQEKCKSKKMQELQNLEPMYAGQIAMNNHDNGNDIMAKRHEQEQGKCKRL